ncbi:MAG: hypothetical protein EXS46_02625 [Candidatus Taylorbacteria bacterium]|nr:hypothetical protein [Candidatus Taylorbacteria bacterium]
MRKISIVIGGALVAFNLAMLALNTFQARQRPASVVLESVVSTPVRVEEKTYKVSFTATPEVQLEINAQ